MAFGGNWGGGGGGGAGMFAGMTLCITGKQPLGTRQQIFGMIRGEGGKHVTSVTKSCTHLIAGATEIQRGTKKVSPARPSRPIVNRAASPP